MANPTFIDQSLTFRDAQVVNGYPYDFWELGQYDYPMHMAQSGIPILNEGGWFDGYSRGTTQWFATLAATNPSRMILGPNAHIMPGIIHAPDSPYWSLFGEDPDELKNAYDMERLRFFDRYLKGSRNRIDTEPPISIYVMNGAR